MSRALVTSLLLMARLAAAEPEPASSAAPSKSECAQAFEESQRLRNAARYLDAHRQVLVCTNPSCGAALSEECGKIYSELQAATPSVVFAAQDLKGKELTGVTVSVDDDPTTHALDGKPVVANPGLHKFTFRAPAFKEHVQTTVLRTGEQFRPITVTLAPLYPERTAPAVIVVSPESPVDSSERSSGPPLATYVLGGVAVLGLGGFAGLRLWGASEYDSLAESCKPDCSLSSVDGVRQKYTLSTISLAVGGAAAIAAVTFYLTAPDSSSSASLQLGPLPNGAAARLSGSF